MSTFECDKDPDAVLDYTWSWAGWLQDGETITDHDVEVVGVEVQSDGVVGGTAVTAWLTGGEVGEPASATCRVTTSAGRVDDRTIRLHVRHR